MYFGKSMPVLMGPLRDSAGYNCINAVCYGIGPYDSTMRSLQTFINYFAKVVGFAPIAVDGKIGADTMAAFFAVRQYLFTIPSSVANGTALTAYATSDQVAENAPTINSILQNEITDLGLQPNAPSVSTTVSTAFKNFFTSPAATVKSNPWPWVVGAGLVAAAAAGAYYLYEG